MRLLVTGASGYLGSRTLRVLRSRGHEPLALVRRTEAADALRRDSFETILGDLDDPASLVAAAESTDGVIHTAFAHDADFALAVEQERRAVGALIEAFDGTGKRLVVATATGVLGDTGPEPVADDFAGQTDFPARIRMGVEDDVRAAAARGVHGAVVRPAILVHGHGAGQFVPMLVAAARARGVAGYPGAGANRLASVHVDDLAAVTVLAAESAPHGATYNAAGGDVSLRELAEAIAAGNPGVRAASLDAGEAQRAWGAFPAMLLGIDNRVDGARARAELGWAPYAIGPDLATDLRAGSYAGARAA